MKEGEGEEESRKTQNFTELRNSPEMERGGGVGVGHGRNWTVETLLLGNRNPSFVEMFKNHFFLEKDDYSLAGYKKLICCDGLEVEPNIYSWIANQLDLFF